MLVSEMFIKPRRIKIVGPQDLDYYVKIYNGTKDLYQSVYSYQDEISVSNVIVDKIYLDFDFDSNMNFLHNVRIMAQYLFDNDYSFYIRFSGNGFHIFILLDDVELKNPKVAIKNYVNYLHKKTETESDPAVVGDLRRVVRVPNTLNLKYRNKRFYCIPISFDELMNQTYEDIRLLAQNPRSNKDFINGHRLLNISEWDKQLSFKQPRQQIIVNHNKIDNSIPPCIQDMMKNPMLGNAGRVQLILFFRDLGYTKEEIEDILYSFLSEEKFTHCVDEEHLIDYLFEKDYTFHDCFIQKDNGFCTSDTCKGHNLYY